MSEKNIKIENSYQPKKECEITLTSGEIIACLKANQEQANEKQKEESK